MCALCRMMFTGGGIHGVSFPPRLVTFAPDQPYLYSHPPGEYMGMEVLSFSGWDDDKLNRMMLELENIWTNGSFGFVER